MTRISAIMAFGVLLLVFASFYQLRVASTQMVPLRPVEQVEQPAEELAASPDAEADTLKQDFHDKKVSPVDYAAGVNARDMTEDLRREEEKAEPAASRPGEIQRLNPAEIQRARRAAEAGDVVSMRLIGRYYSGLFPQYGIVKDAGEAEYWLRRAAKEGDVDSMLLLARVLEEQVGGGKPELQAEADHWRNKGAAATKDVSEGGPQDGQGMDAAADNWFE